jgi:hypothetical protein
MAKLSRWAALVCIIAAIVACRMDAEQQKVNADAALLQDFKKRVDAYMELHNRLEKQAPPLKETNDPAKIKESQNALAALIRKERAGVKQGEIFTPEIANLFRKLLYPELKGTDGAETKKAMKDDAPPRAAIPIKVNARYPDEQPLPTVPPNVLASLPELPKDLEYRIIGNDLILRDVHANIIVDFMLKAIR